VVSVNLFVLIFTIQEPVVSAHLGWFIALQVFITAMLVIELKMVVKGRC
jgi:hypothetical protein